MLKNLTQNKKQIHVLTRSNSLYLNEDSIIIAHYKVNNQYLIARKSTGIKSWEDLTLDEVTFLKQLNDRKSFSEDFLETVNVIIKQLHFYLTQSFDCIFSEFKAFCLYHACSLGSPCKIPFCPHCFNECGIEECNCSNQKINHENIFLKSTYLEKLGLDRIFDEGNNAFVEKIEQYDHRLFKKSPISGGKRGRDLENTDYDSDLEIRNMRHISDDIDEISEPMQGWLSKNNKMKYCGPINTYEDIKKMFESVECKLLTQPELYRGAFCRVSFSDHVSM